MIMRCDTTEDRALLIQWAASASSCWRALSAAALLAGMAHLLNWK